MSPVGVVLGDGVEVLVGVEDAAVATGDTLDPAELAEGPLFPELGEPQPTRTTPGVRSSARQRRITLRGQIGDLAR